MKDKANKSNSLKGSAKVSRTQKDKDKKTESGRETIGVDDKLLGDDLEIKKACETEGDTRMKPDAGENNY